MINAAESLDAAGSIAIRTRRVELSEADLGELVAGSSVRPGPHVTLEVQDDGCGMDRGTRARIFDPFFTTKATGRGLGLAAALGIVHRHGGGIEVASPEIGGTRFRVSLPVSEGEPRAIEQRQSEDLSGRGLVLVVDDDEYVLQAVYHALESYGYSVILAEGGRRAVEFYRQRSHEIDLVLLDMMMPGMGGLETFKALRAINPDVRVIVTTGYDQREAAARFAQQGLAGFLRKPFDPEELAAEVRRLLGGSTETPPEAGIGDPLAELRASYRRELPAKLDALDAALCSARDGGSLEAARHLAHTLKGTSGSYGFAAFCTALEDIEERIGSGGSSAEQIAWDQVDEAVRRARASLQEETASTASSP